MHSEYCVCLFSCFPSFKRLTAFYILKQMGESSLKIFILKFSVSKQCGLSHGLINSCIASNGTVSGGQPGVVESFRCLMEGGLLLSPACLQTSLLTLCGAEVFLSILTNSRHQNCMCCRCYVWAFSHNDYPSLEEYAIFSVSHSPPVCIKRRIAVHTLTNPWFELIKSDTLITLLHSTVFLPHYIHDVLVTRCFLNI